MKRIVVNLLLVVYFQLNLLVALADQATDNVIDKCVLIETLVGRGSGLLYRLPNGNLFVITCRHVIEDGYCMVIKDVNGRAFKPIVNDKGQCEVFFAKDRDMALARIIDPKDKKLQWFDRTTQIDSISIGQVVSCYGDSQGQGVMVESTGRILGVGPISFELDADIVPGNSGGPILQKKTGKIAGIASYVSKDSDKWNQGTRFDNAIRRFGIRFDTVDWNNLSQGFSFYDKLRAQDDYGGIHILAGRYKASGNLNQASRGYRWGMEHGHALSTASYAKLFLNPLFEQFNPQKGVQLLQYNANKGNKYAQECLGEYYEQKKDYKTSLFWHKQAADNGNEFSAEKVGEFFERGLGTSVDGQQAIKYYSQAEPVSPRASFQIGKIFEEGKIVPQDFSRAYAAFLKTALIDYVDKMAENFIQDDTWNPCDDPDTFSVCEARYRLAKLLQQGKGCQKNPLEAKRWLQKSHSLGDPSGQAAYALATLEEKETGRIDAALFQEALRKGHKDALCRKGIDLLRARSYRESFSCLNQAAKKGSAQAARAIENNPELKRLKTLDENDPWML